ncbi:MAG: lectin MVL [Dolichospermum sp. JUN01]|jgi:hypothetical protein|nr:lectin MVL [Dolichospermum sp. JUN01]QSV54191.1 MAG: lectin MVL [Dolichospermum sp. UKL201]
MLKNFKNLISVTFTIVFPLGVLFTVGVNSASALDVKAGPIWSNEDAQVKCPVATAAVGGIWNGHWTTTEWGVMSVCGVNNVKAGPIWNNNDAKSKCPVAATAAGGTWNGQWKTTVPGVMSVCGVN